MPNEQRIGSIYAGLQTLLVHIQEVNFYEIHAEQSSIENVKAQDIIQTVQDISAQHETLRTYSGDTGFDFIKIQRYGYTEIQGKNRKIQ